MDKLNYNSLRAKEARAGKVLGNFAVRFIIGLMAALGVLGWAYLVFFAHNSLGWLLLAIAILGWMALTWIKNEVMPVPVGKNTDDVNDLLSANVLRIMDKNPTPQKLAQELHKTRSGKFLALRFGLGPKTLEVFASELSEDMAPVLATAREIWREVNGETISGGMLAIAIVKNNPIHDELLKQMRLDLSDLYTGITWYNYLHGLVKNAHKRRRDGGIARDLTFGYIPLLQHFGHNLSNQRAQLANRIRLAAHRETVEKMISIFSGNGRQNVALIGPDGSGRSTIVRAFAEAIMDADAPIPTNLKYRQVFMLDAATLIAAADGAGKLEGLVMRILGEAYAAKNIIIGLDNAQLFFEEGVGSVDISNVLLPILEAGKLRVILTMNEQKYLEIAARNSMLANSLNKIMIPEANQEETMKVMQDQVPQLEAQYNVICTFWALMEAYRLSQKYIHDVAMPARALNLLESACNYAEQGFVTAQSVQQAVEKTQGVKVQTATSEVDRAKLLNLESLIHQRMVDQQEAVKIVSDALRRSAAGVRNENRPIGTFLFLGPTGVGKTELAKALAEVYFGGEGNIVRLDLNEYVTAGDVTRLIAEGAENAESLTAQIMKYPFSVVLLDEIEKAHPQVLTTLLQMLDEGILRDSKNHEVSFRDAIVIATSNAGAERIREYINNGMDLAELKQELTNALIKEGQFKPEFLNRFDEICVFKPLSKEDLMKVMDLMIASVNKTLAPQKITVVLDEEAKRWLIDQGYDPQMGARPMRRIVQKSVENLVAKLVLSGAVGNGSTINVTKAMLEE